MRFYIGLLSLVLLTGCAQFQPHSQHAININYFQLGDAGYQAWLKQKDKLVLLAQAKRDLARGLEQQPDNIKAQFLHYRASAALAMALGKTDEAELLSYFNKMNPSLYPETVSPAYVTYAVLYNQAQQADSLEKDYSQLESALFRAIQQNPYTSQNWLLLSGLYREQDKINLALATAKKAYQMMPNQFENTQAVAMSLNNIAESDVCLYQQSDLLADSLNYFEKALKQAGPRSNNLREYIAFQHFRLGEIQVAQQTAFEAFNREPKYTNSLLLFEASLLTANYSAAEQALNYLQAEYEGDKTRQYPVLLALAQQDNELLGHLLSQFLADAEKGSQNPDLNLYIALLIDYIQQNTEDASYALRVLKNSPRFYDLYASERFDSAQRSAFISQFDNVCDLSDAYYLLGFKALRVGYDKLAFQYFNQVVNQKAYRQDSYLWSRLMLNAEPMKAFSAYLSQIKALAEQGEAQAQFDLGLELLLAELIPQDRLSATDWFAKAAAQDHLKAINLLAYLYLSGELIPTDINKAVRLYARASALGDSEANFQLGQIYLNGEYQRQDSKLAFNYFTQAAEAGHADAYAELAHMYLTGQGTLVNEQKAFAMLEKSALAGSYQGQLQLGLFYQQKADPESEMTAKAWFSIARQTLKKSGKTSDKLNQLIDNLVVPEDRVVVKIQALQQQMADYKASLPQASR